ncbi:hypothetical protein DM806_24015 [Sphingobium lactosutens]|uniref:hypothetical protein n=1 Tax=Sphingobium lactosutens TaxID=522773 RepID=UPI0015BCE484|nr:hypothetical protein [Sphingobium lactosutens]NWK98672.1 hypothetical protein [Sphingobium lactosutens]
MATVHVTLSRVDDRGDTGGSLPVVTSVPELAQTLISSSASQASTIAAPKADGLVWTVVPTGNVFVKFGAAPVANSGEGHLVLAGQARDFSVTSLGEKIAVKDA